MVCNHALAPGRGTSGARRDPAVLDLRRAAARLDRRGARRRRQPAAAASRFGVSRSALSRHRQHTAPAEPVTTERDPFAEAIKLYERAGSDRERLRGLEAVRASVDLELRDFTQARAALKSPTPDQLAKLEENVSAAWAAYEQVATGSHDSAIRALQGVRAAVVALRQATARHADDTIELRLWMGFGDPIPMAVSRQATWDLYGVPVAYRSDAVAVRLAMAFVGTPRVEVLDAEGRVMWERGPGAPPYLGDFDPEDRGPDDAKPNGNGNGRG